MPHESTIWPLDGHTTAKHRILRKYLDAWLPIMGIRGNGRLVLVDGFAGPGVYEGGEPGSPIIMLDAFLKHSARVDIKAELVYVFIEQNKARVEELERQVVALGKLPSQVNVEIVHDTYQSAFGGMLDTLDEAGHHIAPTFAFIDPFGYSDAPMPLTGRLFQFERCEVLLYVPFPFIVRFLARNGQAPAMDALFGGNEWQQAIPFTGKKRLDFLHDLFERKLRECGLGYVRSFQIVSSSGAHGYHLFFGTTHLRGMERMKDAMWNLDPIAGTRFRDSTDIGKQVLFDPDPDYHALTQLLVDHYGSRVFTIDDALDFTTAKTPFRKQHVKRGVLADMERDGHLEAVNPAAGRKARTYPDGTQLRFI